MVKERTKLIFQLKNGLAFEETCTLKRGHDIHHLYLPYRIKIYPKGVPVCAGTQRSVSGLMKYSPIEVPTLRNVSRIKEMLFSLSKLPIRKV